VDFSHLVDKEIPKGEMKMGRKWKEEGTKQDGRKSAKKERKKDGRNKGEIGKSGEKTSGSLIP
jgi:hypothetical protein